MAERVKRKKREWLIKDVGRGTFRLRTGKIVKPMERFLAYEDDISPEHRDLIHKLDGSDYGAEAEEVEAEAEEVTNEQGEYYKQERETKGWFDVFDPQEGRVNEKALRENTADAWIESLNAQ